MKTIDGKEVSDEAAQFYDRVKAGERIEVAGSAKDHKTFNAVGELMHAGLIETQALVWETRVCYVLTGTDPRRDAVANLLRSEEGVEVGELADKILAVLR